MTLGFYNGMFSWGLKVFNRVSMKSSEESIGLDTVI